MTAEVRRLLAEAVAWDREADKLARQNPVFLRDAIRSCRNRAKRLRFQARLEEQAQQRKDAA